MQQNTKILVIAILILTLANCGFIKLGGFQQQSLEELEKKNNVAFQMANKTAREEFLSEYNETLGKIVSVHSQVVSGLRYKIVYESDLGRVETSLWVQVWLHRVKLEYFKFLDNQTKLASDNASATENSGTKTVVGNKETGTDQVQKNVADVTKQQKATKIPVQPPAQKNPVTPKKVQPVPKNDKPVQHESTIYTMGQAFLRFFGF